MENSKLTLDPQGDNFLLRQVTTEGTAVSMTLSDSDVLKLAQSARTLRHHVLAKRSREGAEAVALTPVAQIELNTDLHDSEIHLAMIDGHGAKEGFLLTLDLAQSLLHRLPTFVARLTGAKPVKQ
jgi:hypothetical protein